MANEVMTEMKGFCGERVAAARDRRGEFDHLVEALDVVHPGHDVLGRPAHAGVVHVHVVGRLRDVGRDAGAQEEVDVVELVHQTRQAVEVLQGGRAVFARFEVDDADGRTAGSQVDPVLGQLQVVPAVAAVKDDPAGRLAGLLHHERAREADACRRPVHLGPGRREHVHGVLEPGLVGEPGFLEQRQRGLVQGMDVGVAERFVLAAWSPFIIPPPGSRVFVFGVSCFVFGKSYFFGRDRALHFASGLRARACSPIPL